MKSVFTRFYTWLLAFALLSTPLFAANRQQVVICASDELSLPLKAISTIDKNETMILLDKGYVTWLQEGDNRWVIFIHPFTQDFISLVLRDFPATVPLVQKGNLIYAMNVETLDDKVKPDAGLLKSAYACLSGPAAQKIFRSYGFEPVSKRVR